MKDIWKLISRRRSEIVAHPFFVWLKSESVPLEDRFVFAPVLIDFIMGFADMNKWFLSYPEPRDALEKGINEHTEEDRTHSRLFYDNWYDLNLGGVERWRPGKALWWLFQSQDSAAVRRFGMDVLDLTVNHPDPLVRFALIEAIEVFGDVFFANTAPIASALTHSHGVEHLYFGEYHRSRETGHLQTDERDFVKAELTAEQRRDAHLVVNRVMDGALAILDELLSYAESALSDRGGHERRLEHAYLSCLSLAGRPSASHEPASAVIAEEQRPLLQQLERRLAGLRAHPFFEWLGTGEQPAPIDKLRRFVALWGMDITSYRDFNELVLRYPTPRSADERAINTWTEELATQSALYLRDWRALGMDRFLRWDMGETIAFYFLGQQSEVHRDNMARVKQYAFRYKQPAVRFWLMQALESSRATLFEGTAPLAQAIEAERGVVLDYWSHRHDPLPPAAARFLGQSISPEDRVLASELVDLIFDNMEAQFALSHREGVSGAARHRLDTLLPLLHQHVPPSGARTEPVEAA